MPIKQSGGNFSFSNVTPTTVASTLKGSIDDTTGGLNDNTSGGITNGDLAGRIVDVIDSAVIIRDVIDPAQNIPTPLSAGQSNSLAFITDDASNTGDSLEVIVDTTTAAAGFAHVLDRAANGLRIRIDNNHFDNTSSDLTIRLDGSGGIGSTASGIAVNAGDGIEIDGSNNVTIKLDGTSLTKTTSGLAVANIANSMLPNGGITLDKLDDFGTISDKGVLGTTTSGGAVVHLNPFNARSAIDFDQGIDNYLLTNGASGSGTTISSITVLNGIITAITVS